jgi:ureidoglycolate hydrolase
MAGDILTVNGRDQAGYGICIDSAESWIVAVNNASPSSDPEEVTFLGSHPNTDETFILIRGKACIATAPYAVPEDFTIIAMEQGVCYNVHRKTWHSVLLAPGAKAAIVENRNPESEKHHLSVEARIRFTREAKIQLEMK